MATVHTEITPNIKRFIRKQHMFFVATAPLSSQGTCEPALQKEWIASGSCRITR